MREMRLQHTPRSATLEHDPPDIVVPALAELRGCKSPFDVLRHCVEVWPNPILPTLAWEGSRKPFIERWAVHVVVKYCGDGLLRQALGNRKTARLLARFPLKEPVRRLDLSTVC